MALVKDKTLFTVTNKLSMEMWNFVGITIDKSNNKSTFYVNDGYGFDGLHVGLNGRLEYYHLNSYAWMSQVFKSPVILGSDEEQSTLIPYDGSISCIQFYNYALDPATVALKKHCPDVPGAYSHKQCGPGYEYFDHWCYKVSLSIATFAQAESLCMPEPESAYESQLMYTENPKHWDYVARLVEDQVGLKSFWAGISDRDKDGSFLSSFGENITTKSPIFVTNGELGSNCGNVHRGKNGYIETGYCEDKQPFVCSSRPYYFKPDYHCPKNFYPYRGNCYFPNRKALPYEDAVLECSKRGSVLLPVKDEDFYSFIRIWGSVVVAADTWVGIRKFKWLQFYDEKDDINPLQEAITTDLSYSDEMPFDPETQFNFGHKRFDTDCYFFKQSANFELRGIFCNKEKAFICQWLSYECPEGYSYIGQISNGRTCHGTPSSATDSFHDASCKSNKDILRDRWTPETPYALDRFRRMHAR